MEAAPARLLLETFTCYQRAASGTTEGIFPFIKVYHLLTSVLIQIKVKFQNLLIFVKMPVMMGLREKARFFFGVQQGLQ